MNPSASTARGVLYMLASALGFSVMSLLVKLASETLPTGEIVLARGIVTLGVSYAMLMRAKVPPWGHDKSRLLWRGLVGFGGLTCYYASLAHLPLADATILQNLTPVATAVLAWYVLAEPVGPRTAIALACGVIGVGLVARPTASGFEPIGIVFALGAVVCSAFAYVAVRQLAQREHPLVVVFYFPLVATPLAIPWAVLDWVTPTFEQWMLLLAIGVATQVGQVFLTMALMIVRAARATSLGYVQVVLAMIWQLWFFGDVPPVMSILGAGLILVGTLAVARR